MKKISRLLISNRIVAALMVMMIGALAASAQNPASQYDRGTPPQHAGGISPLNSYLSADLGTINLSNGSLNFRIPIGQVGGRGFWLPLTLNYSSKVWSGSRGTYFDIDLGNRPSAFAVYDDLANPGDAYSKVAPGWTVGAAPTIKAQGIGINSFNNQTTGCIDYTWMVVKLTLVLPDKGEIEFRDDAFDGAPTLAQVNASTGCRDMDSYRGTRWHATDGSGTIFINDTDNGVIRGDVSGTVITADGMRYHFTSTSGNVSSAYVRSVGRCDSVRDRNGNQINITYPTATSVRYTDQFGRLTMVDYGSNQNPGVVLTVTVPGYNGASRTYTATTGYMRDHYRLDAAQLVGAQFVYNGAYPSGVAGLELFPLSHESGFNRIDDRLVLAQLQLPDGRLLKFKYNQFGEVAEVETPTSGKVQYDFQSQMGLPTGNSLLAEVFASPGGGNVAAVDRAVTERRTYPDGNTAVTPEGKWTYTYNAVVTNGVTTGNTIVKGFSGAGTLLLDERHYFKEARRYLNGSTASGVEGTGYSLWSTGLERRSEMRDSNGTSILAASEQDWQKRTTVSWTTGYGPAEDLASDNRISESRRILDDGSVAKVKTSYDTEGDAHTNNPKIVEEYDFGAATPKRYTTTTYVTDTNYIGNHKVHLLSLPLQQSVFDGADMEVARTVYEYDNYAINNPNDPNNRQLLMYGDVVSIPGRDVRYNEHTPPQNQQFTLKRGNVTGVTRFIKLSAPTESITSYTRYDVLGNVVSIKDPKGNVSSISYTDNFGVGANPDQVSGGTNGPTYGLPTLITSPPPNTGEAAHTARSQYDFSTGLLTGFKDRNGIIAQTLYNDLFDRPTQINVALGTSLENHTQMFYAGLNPVFVDGVTLTKNDMLTRSDQNTVNDGNFKSWTKTDGFGRTIESWSRDPQGDVKVESNYDGLGRARQTSNPFRPSVAGESALYTTLTYDLASRVIQVTTPDLASVFTSYSGNQVTVRDQANKQRKSYTDGLGRLTQVDELNAHPLTTLYAATTYLYDALDDLTTVTQVQGGTFPATQTRSFEYDALKRLKQATNPESGTVNYTYDNNSNLSTKQDARSITTNYAYDNLNRIKSRTYSAHSANTPAVNYFYDGQSLPSGFPATLTRGLSTGKLVAVTYGSGSNGSYSGDYDALGRVATSFQQTEGINYHFAYEYNLSGALTREVYPSGRDVRMEYNTDGKLAGVRNHGAASYYAGAAPTDASNRLQYYSHGAISKMKLGNTLIEQTTFNSRLQPTQIKLGTSASPASLLQLDYGYGSTTQNNGNIMSQTITMPKTAGGNLTLTQSYTYDEVNRLKTAAESGGSTAWSETFNYDRFGNMWVTSPSGITLSSHTPQSQSAFVAATNRLNPQVMANIEYDNVGNLTKDRDSREFEYDAENRQYDFQNGTTTYGYDGDGRRVRKQDASGIRLFVYNAMGQLIAEYTSGTPQPEGGGGTSYLTTDHLGSTRMVTKSDMSVKARYDYLPFGEEVTVSRSVVAGFGSADSTKQKFTGYERDAESGLDFAQARYCSSMTGRFMSPDPLAASARTSNPQTWNRYTYVVNNPLRYIDPTGMFSAELETQKQIRQAEADYEERLQHTYNAQAATRAAHEGDWDTFNELMASDSTLTVQQPSVAQTYSPAPFVISNVDKFEQQVIDGDVQYLDNDGYAQCARLPLAWENDQHWKILDFFSRSQRLTPNWVMGAALTYGMNLQKGTVVATFNRETGIYARTNAGEGGENHTAVFLAWEERNGVRGMRVAEQMSGYQGRARIGFIPFQAGAKYFQDAGRFNVVNIRRPQ